MQLEVVEAQRVAAAMEVKARQQPRLNGHARAELERDPAGIRHVQRAPLMREISPDGFELQVREVLGQALELLVGEDAKGDPHAVRRVGCDP